MSSSFLSAFQGSRQVQQDSVWGLQIYSNRLLPAPFTASLTSDQTVNARGCTLSLQHTLCIRWSMGMAWSSCLEKAAANILSALLEGLNPQTIPQDGDGPQGPYKPTINPQIRDIKAATAGKTGFIYWHPTRATSRRVSHLFHCRLILSRSTTWSCVTASLMCLSTPALI